MRGWEPDRQRWTRMHKGRRFRRTPKQLGLPPDQWTEEGSYPAWIAWFKAAVELAELKAENKRIWDELYLRTTPAHFVTFLLAWTEEAKGHTLDDRRRSIEFSKQWLARLKDEPP